MGIETKEKINFKRCQKKTTHDLVEKGRNFPL